MELYHCPEKLWKKCGSFFALGAAGLVDLLVGLLAENLPDLQALSVCPALFLPMAAVWYILIEIGSVAENAAALGAPVPAWLKKGVEQMKKTVEPQQLKKQKKKE